jgi:hypothetical protein
MSIMLKIQITFKSAKSSSLYSTTTYGTNNINILRKKVGVYKMASLHGLFESWDICVKVLPFK